MITINVRSCKNRKTVFSEITSTPRDVLKGLGEDPGDKGSEGLGEIVCRNRSSFYIYREYYDRSFKSFGISDGDSITLKYLLRGAKP